MLSGLQPDMVEMSCKWTIPFHVEGELMAWAVTCMFSMALLITERDGNEGTITWADYLGRYPIRRNPSVYAFFFRRWHRPSTQKRSRRISRRNVAAKVVTDRCWHPLRWFSSHRSIRFTSRFSFRLLAPHRAVLCTTVLGARRRMSMQFWALHSNGAHECWERPYHILMNSIFRMRM